MTDPVPAARPIDRLLEIMARLRDPVQGCPWDRVQTFATIAPYTIEEAYEVADAAERGDREELRQELGDLLLQVVYHARMAEEEGSFAFDDVADAIAAKMVARHPHVFGTHAVSDAAEMNRNWEAQKALERDRKARTAGNRARILDGIATSLPAMTRALKLQRRAARVGFDWPEIDEVFDKINEEIEELKEEISGHELASSRAGLPQPAAAHAAEEFGDLMFAMVNLARWFGIDPDQALRGANAKFEGRFRHIETELETRGKSLQEASLAEMEAIWVLAKGRRPEQGEA